ncbi:MAG: Transcriptional regulator, MerR family [Micavibrio sp.]|nr:Transcriptional regulator, MerR family [Micavibrio sp.]
MTAENVKQNKAHFDVAATGGSEEGDVVTAGKKAPGAFRTISEVADELNVQQHVLRFWETKFSQVKPLKRGGGRRYYRPEDVLLLKKIHTLLYTEGYTIKGVQKLLKTLGKAQLLADVPPDQQATAKRAAPAPANEAKAGIVASVPANEPAAAKATGTIEISDKQRSILHAMLGDLKDLRDMIAVEK